MDKTFRLVFLPHAAFCKDIKKRQTDLTGTLADCPIFELDCIDSAASTHVMPEFLKCLVVLNIFKLLRQRLQSTQSTIPASEQ